MMSYPRIIHAILILVISVAIWPCNQTQAQSTPISDCQWDDDDCTSALSIAWQPETDILAIGWHNGDIILYNEALEEVGMLPQSPRDDSSVQILKWSHDGTKLAVDRGYTDLLTADVEIWNMETLSLDMVIVVGFPEYRPDDFINWSPDDTLLAIVQQTTVEIWDIQTESQWKVMEGSGYLVDGVLWSNDGSQLMTLDLDKAIRVWDIEAESLLTTITPSDEYIQTMAWSPDETLVVLSQREDLVIWDITANQPLQILSGHPQPIRDVQWCEERLATASADAVYVWDVETWEPINSFNLDGLNVKWNSDCTLLAILDTDEIVIWNMLEDMQISMPQFRELN